ncbi:hypothetical protein MRX96_027023 [Rhipicephalus microplus]
MPAGNAAGEARHGVCPAASLGHLTAEFPRALSFLLHNLPRFSHRQLCIHDTRERTACVDAGQSVPQATRRERRAAGKSSLLLSLAACIIISARPCTLSLDLV